MKSFCTRLGISQGFFTPITPQQNGVVERKNIFCKVEFNQPLCWLYFMPNLLVI